MTFARPALLAMVAPSLPVTTYSDPELAVYRRLGFGRATLGRAVGRPSVWKAFLGLALKGKFPSRPQGQDPLQLGGDIVLDADCRVAWKRAQRGPEDYPTFDELRAAATTS